MPEDPTSHPGVTVALPVFNEEQILVDNVRRLSRYLDGLAVPWQILIGSNGSTDSTMDLAKLLQQEDERISSFHLPHRGVGLAFAEFIRLADYPLLISLDMDLSADLVFVDRALELGRTHDIVVGSKKLATQQRSLFRKAGSDFFLLCTRLLTGLPYDDYSIGAKAYRVEFLRSVTEPIDAGSSYVLDLCHVAHKAGRPVARVPVSCEDRRVSKFNLGHEAVYKFSRLFGLWARTAGRQRTSGARQTVGTTMVAGKTR